MAKHKPTIKVTKQTQTSARAVWLIEYVYPAMSGIWGKSYRATTYPESHLLYLETAAKRLRVAPGVARVIEPQIRAALVKAGVVFAPKPAAITDIGDAAADQAAHEP